jgi:hypothetical protein
MMTNRIHQSRVIRIETPTVNWEASNALAGPEPLDVGHIVGADVAGDDLGHGHVQPRSMKNVPRVTRKWGCPSSPPGTR